MNPIEMLLFGAAYSNLSEKSITNSLSCSIEERASLWIIAQGMRRQKFRYNQGILEDPIFPWFYESVAAIDFIRDKLDV